MIRKPSILFCLMLVAFLSVAENANSQNKNWTFLRGSNLNGIAETDNIPLKWDDPNVRWKTEIHGKGWSSPVVFDNQIWVTTANPDGKELYAVSVDFNTGEIIYDINVFTPDEVVKKHSMNSYATPTPCIEKNFVYVHYGSLGTACINTTNGSIVWKVTDLKCRQDMGAGSSPIIYKNLLILHYDGNDVRYIVALNKSTGKLVWRSDRPTKPYEPLNVLDIEAFITPLILNVKGRDMLISNGSAIYEAFDPNTGKEIWRVVRGAECTVTMPFSENGVVFWYTGSMAVGDGSYFSELLAVNPDGKGDITASNILWRKKTERGQLQSPVLKDGLIYTVDPKNNLMCIDAETGEEIWLTHLRSTFNASPIYANGIIWFFSVRGDVIAIKSGRKYEVVAQSLMDSPIWATPAFVRNSVIVRTETYLTRIGQ